MTCRIKASEDNHFVIMTIEGDLTTALALEYNREAFALAKELGINRFLVDLTGSRNVDSPSEKYAFARRRIHQVEGMDPSARMAALVLPGDRSHNFIETVLQNQGFDLALFRDRFQALRYLEDD